LLTDVDTRIQGSQGCAEPTSWWTALQPNPLTATLFPIMLAQTIPMNLVQLANIFGDLTNALTAMHGLREYLHIDQSPSGVSSMPDVEGCVEFRDVTFAYPRAPDKKVFDGFDLKIDVGQVCALVGPSGSGKSTTIALLERFYDPTSGGVFLDGKDLKALNLSWLRSQLGLVSQEPVLFDGTVEDNISLGKDGSTPDDAREAAVRANANEFISALPDGYETQVGASGRSSLSGGQKQRIAIARALVRKPAILLLDEATSALDNESEKVVQQSLNDLMATARFTTVVIAHRLATIRHAHKIALVSGGRIHEEGTHDVLVKMAGKYFNLLHASDDSKSGQTMSA